MNLTHRISVGKSAYRHRFHPKPRHILFCLHHNRILLISYHLQCYLFRCYCLLFMLIVVVFSMLFFHQWKEFYALDLCETYGSVGQTHLNMSITSHCTFVTKTLYRPPLTFCIYFYLLQFSLWHSSKYVYALQANTNPQRRMLNVDVCL